MIWSYKQKEKQSLKKACILSSVVCRSRSTSLCLLAAGVALLYGGERSEVIRFMDTDAMQLEGDER